MTVLIKRYANRKLYNTDTSRYITLKGISQLLEDGEEVRVIDNETGDDITNVALSQILVDSERTGREVPRTIFTDLFQKGGDALYGAIKRGIGETGDELRDNMRRMADRNEKERERLREWVASGTPDFDHVLQNAFERVFKLVDLPRRSDIEALNQNLERVAEAIEMLEKRRRASAGDD
jgi:polyhydroxyalkanoate synthesis repressor PhaR